jgi:hypothetical protein
MMASLIKDPFDSLDWIFETKMDGYRAIAVIDSAGKARIPATPLLQLPIRTAVALLALLDPEGWQSGLMHRS